MSRGRRGAGSMARRWQKREQEREQAAKLKRLAPPPPKPPWCDEAEYQALLKLRRGLSE